MQKTIFLGLSTFIASISFVSCFLVRVWAEQTQTIQEIEDGYYSFTAENLEGIFRKSGNNLLVSDVAYHEDISCYQGTIEQGNSVTNVKAASMSPSPEGYSWEINFIDSINFDVNHQKLTALNESQKQQIEECNTIFELSKKYTNPILKTNSRYKFSVDEKVR